MLTNLQPAHEPQAPQLTTRSSALEGSNSETLTTEETQSLMRLAWIIETFREVHPKIPASYIAAFLAVALKPGNGPTEYSKVLGTIQPVTSRLLLEIGPRVKEGERTGLGLVARRISLENLRNTEYTLSGEGFRLAHKIARILHQGRAKEG